MIASRIIKFRLIDIILISWINRVITAARVMTKIVATTAASMKFIANLEVLVYWWQYTVDLKQQERTEEQLANVYRGGYILNDCSGTPELILIATGSEVELAVAAYHELTAAGRKVRVVSMPSTDAFDKQDQAYKESVLPSSVTARLAIEAGISDFWDKYVGLNGKIIGMTSFGESGRAEQLFA